MVSNEYAEKYDIFCFQSWWYLPFLCDNIRQICNSTILGVQQKGQEEVFHNGIFGMHKFMHVLHFACTCIAGVPSAYSMSLQKHLRMSRKRFIICLLRVLFEIFSYLMWNSITLPNWIISFIFTLFFFRYRYVDHMMLSV